MDSRVRADLSLCETPNSAHLDRAMQMKYTPVGRTGVHASILGVGAMTCGEKNVWKLGGLGQDTVNKTVARAVAAGIKLFDTDEVYDDGESEKSLGRAL